MKLKLLAFAFTSLLIFAEKTICVTGGAGFIGGHFAEYMFNKYPDYHLVILDSFTYSGNMKNIPRELRESSRVEIIKKSICDKDAVDNIFKRVDMVVHFAAETDVTRSISDDEVFFETNVMGTRNLLHHLVKYRNSIEKFVHISSSEVYGTCEGDEITEKQLLKPMSPYAASKAGAERAVYAYGCAYDVPVVILRFFNNYGPRQHLEKLVGKFITFAMLGKTLTVHGDGSQMRDWVHVVDTARAIDKALHHPNFEMIRNEAINCGTGIATSVLDIAQIIVDEFKLPHSTIKMTTDRPGQVTKHLSSTEKSARLLGWQPTIPFEKGLKDTIQWYVNNKDAWYSEIDCAQLYKDNSELIKEKEREL